MGNKKKFNGSGVWSGPFFWTWVHLNSSVLTFTVGSDAYLNLISADPPLPYKRGVMLRICFSTFSSIFSCFVIHDHWSETGFCHFLRDIYYLSYLTDENCSWTNTTLSHGRFLWRPLPKVAVYRSEHPETSHLCAARPSVHLCHSQGQSLTLSPPAIVKCQIFRHSDQSPNLHHFVIFWEEDSPEKEQLNVLAESAVQCHHLNFRLTVESM